MDNLNNLLRIYEIYPTIMGEISCVSQGTPVVIVRFAGCNLRCDYCDTKYAQDIEHVIPASPEDAHKIVKEFGISRVLLTGGEPLIQDKEVIKGFIYRLVRDNFEIFIETNGTIHIGYSYNYPRPPQLASIIMDWKIPTNPDHISVMVDSISIMEETDWVKFVIQNEEDYKQVRLLLPLIFKIGKMKVAISPVTDRLSPNTLIGWVIRDRLNVTVNLQLHKLINLKEGGTRKEVSNEIMEVNWEGDQECTKSFQKTNLL